MLVIMQQIKAARALLGWGQDDVAIKSDVAISTIRRLEASGGPLCARFDTIAKIRRTFEEAGIDLAVNHTQASAYRLTSSSSIFFRQQMIRRAWCSFSKYI
ncbi:helix-turn-helix domain-containing protein [Bradyrhizobium yuanmingense]|uniref:helix-turn-helix domain-containing protein n=1 Tax=Bradyrhizobium yuanmingense TaxID=108015 RepID=UPI0023B8D067|nr:transcriptional regulator [Bradyrhizobium yuanmingense]MDF0584946.1 transcriptional regulator [Bradyrhizobium yuanmingense]